MRKSKLQAIGSILATAGVLFWRRPYAALHPQFFAEDGMIFWLAQYQHGWRAVAENYMGYLHFMPRVIAGVGAWFDPARGPVLYYAGSLLCHLAVVAVLFSGRIRLPWKPAIALATVLVPHTDEVFTNLTNIQWPLALGLVLLAIADDPATPGQGWFDRLALAVIGLTGPFSLVFLPVFAVRAWRRRSRESAVLLAVCAAAALVQGIELVVHPREIAESPSSPVFAATVIAYRFWGVLLTGFRYPTLTADWRWIDLGVVLTALFFWRLLRPGPGRETRVPLALAWLALAATLTLKFQHDAVDVASPENADRYFYLPHVIVLWWLILEAAALRGWPRWLPLAAASFAVAMGYSRFMEGPRPILPWATELAPVRAHQPFAIPTQPGDYVIESPARSPGT